VTEPKIGIIGCGKQGEKHAAALRALGAAIVCADADAEAARRLASREGARVVAAEDILSDQSIGGIVIATPTLSHFNLISAALGAGKHVLCEKPLALRAAQAEALLGLEQETGRYVTVGFVYRYVPAFERLYALGRNGALGPLVHACLRIGGRGEHREWKHNQVEGGGVVNEMAVHMLDLALWLFGPLLRPAVVSTAQLLPSRTIGGEIIAADADDYLVIRAETEDGAPILLIADMVTPSFVQYLDAQYGNASAFASIDANFPARLFLKEARAGMGAGAQKLGDGPADLYRRQAEAFLRVVGGATPGCNRIADSIAVARLVEEISAQMAGTRRRGRAARHEHR
jgi:predicted dehydrogenase